ncbi:thermonuclease family protein [bacterium]|nr:thermonuclease family protein [candidate division CSSED10-310 bacterium]
MKTLTPIAWFLLIIIALTGPTGCDDSDSGSPTEPGEPSPGPYTTRTATVTRIIDGDTIVVNSGEKVRYIGIDTPETGDCYYSEATMRNTDLVDHRVVTLEVCNASPTDQYGRTLAHVHVDGILVNAVLIREGYARAISIPPCTSRSDDYRQMMDDAFADGAGMWSACY